MGDLAAGPARPVRPACNTGFSILGLTEDADIRPGWQTTAYLASTGTRQAAHVDVERHPRYLLTTTHVIVGGTGRVSVCHDISAYIRRRRRADGTD
jgi:hypothetical protein